MRGVRCTGLSNFEPDLQVIPVNDVCKAVAADRVVPVKVSSIHMPDFLPSYTWIFLPHGTYVLKHKSLLGGLEQHFRFIILIICLLGYAKQFAQAQDLIDLGILCMQGLYCSAPDFFLIGILKASSARSIIMS